MIAPAGSTPKGAAAPTGSLANREIERRAARARDGRFLKQFEALSAFGYRPVPADMVIDYIYNHLLRDLPRTPSSNPARSPSPKTRASAPLGATPALRRPVDRRPVTPESILAARDPEKLLTLATPAELADAEARLPDLLDHRTAKRHASARASNAFAWRRRISQSLRLLTRLYRFTATPAQRRRIAGLQELRRDASLDYEAARFGLDAERVLYRRALSLPAPRDRKANRSRHRVARGHRRCPRWWEATPARKPASGLRNGPSAPRWRDLSEAGAIYPHVAAGYRFGRVLAFTLNLTGETEAEARKQPDPAAWLKARIVRRLKQSLKRDVEVLVSLEFNEAGALHAHGTVAGVSLGDDQAVKDALKLAGGTGYRGRYQVVLKAQPDSGWASYLAKHYAKPFQWNRFSATRGLAAAAREIFAGMRAFVVSFEVTGNIETSRKSTLTEVSGKESEDNTCESPRHMPMISPGTNEDGKCTREQSQDNSSPTSMTTYRSRDGPTPDR